MTGVCAECGPVKLRWRSGPRAGAPRTVACPTPKKLERQKTLEQRKEWLYTHRRGVDRKADDPRKFHGLSVEEAREFRRGKVCAICGSVDMLVVDHCHETGQIRDVLCDGCNRGLGGFQDDPVRLAAAIEYLKLHQPSNVTAT